MEGPELSCPDREHVAAASVIGSGRYLAEYDLWLIQRYVPISDHSFRGDEAISLGRSNSFFVSRSSSHARGNSGRCRAGLLKLRFIRRITGCHFDHYPEGPSQADISADG